MFHSELIAIPTPDTVASRRAVIDDCAACHGLRIKLCNFTLGAKQFPWVKVGPRNETVARQVGRVRGRTVGFQIAWRCTQNTGVIRQLPTLQTAVRQWGTSKGQVKTAFDGIKAGIRQAQVQRQIGEKGLEFGQERHDVQLCETAGRGKAQGAMGADTLAAQRRLCGL